MKSVMKQLDLAADHLWRAAANLQKAQLATTDQNLSEGIFTLKRALSQLEGDMRILKDRLERKQKAGVA